MTQLKKDWEEYQRLKAVLFPDNAKFMAEQAKDMEIWKRYDKLFQKFHHSYRRNEP